MPLHLRLDGFRHGSLACRHDRGQGRELPEVVDRRADPPATPEARQPSRMRLWPSPVVSSPAASRLIVVILGLPCRA
jgi:hypothetical protein